MTRLSHATLAGTVGRARVHAPHYDRSAVKPGIVHLGVGAFHRAHQAIYTETCLNAGDLRWGVIGASLRAPAVGEQLNPQDGLYTCLVREGAESTAQIVGAIKRVLVATHEREALLEAMAHADAHIVSLTITEKGYKLDPATGALMLEDSDIQADIATPDAPRTAPGLIVAALARRRAKGLSPFTALSCDNLPDNGARLRNAVLTLAQEIDRDLAAWITAHGAFPATMVDRIVPATTPEDIAALEASFGYRDEGLVKTEPFSQWVIEDAFAGPRPAWERFGAQFTNDVHPWELAKLRLLNGAHSAIAYLGALAGHRHVHDAMADATFQRFIQRLHDEAAATLTPPAGLDLDAYRRDLLARFANSALMHRTHQIAMDGSQKIPQRLLNTIRHRLDHGAPFDALALAVAGWVRWQTGRDEAGGAYPVEDPLAARTAAIAATHLEPNAFTRAIVQLDAVFGADLASDSRFVEAISTAVASLWSLGARETVRRFAQGA